MKTYLTLLLFLCLPILVVAQPADQPEPRAGHELVWHDGLGMVLLVNGDNPPGDHADAIWGWDGEAWQIVDDDSPRQTLGGVAYDPTYNLLILYGGSRSIDDYNRLTWFWDGERWGGDERPGQPPTPDLVERDHFSMVYDVSRKQIILYGGQYFPTRTFYHDTWVWNGFQDGWGWVQAATEAPDTRYHYAMAYDSVREQVLIFGGSSQTGGDHNDLWAWDGTAWNVIDDGTGPSRRAGARMAFDGASGNMVLFGGRVGNTPQDDTWLWDGEMWTEYTGEAAPPARSHHAMAYDPIRGKIVLFGGYADENLNDTWTWDMQDGWVQAAE